MSVKCGKSALKQEHRPRMLENKIGRIFVCKTQGVTRGYRTLDNDLHILYSLPHINMVIKYMMRLVGHVAPMGEMKIVYKFFVRKPEGNRAHENMLEVRERTILWHVDPLLGNELTNTFP
jgi:hypothetical protein